MFINKKNILRSFQNFYGIHTSARTKKPVPVKSLNLIKHGKPTEVLEMKEHLLRATHTNQVLVKILASPIHPIDVKNIHGIKPPACAVETLFPITPGRECVAEVVSIGTNVSGIVEGERVVVPFADTLRKRGTWSTHALYDAEDLLPIPEYIGIPEAATLTYAPCMAYRILKDFIDLTPGDGILFNGGNSAIGQALHQLCKAWNLQSFSIVRPGADDVRKHLKCLGATQLFSYDELKETKAFEDGTFEKPLITLSLVTRSSSKILGNYIDPKGVTIAHGCMAGLPTTIATLPLVFKDFVQRPFWITRWNKNNPAPDERYCMFNTLFELIRQEKFRSPQVELVPFKDYKDAFAELEKNQISVSTKYVLDMQCEG